MARPIRYVALGDSYTIGTAVTARERFPDQLVAAVAAPGSANAAAPGSANAATTPTLELVANLGVNGYTTADLIRDELPALDGLEPGFVTLGIGVNDVVQGVPPAAYQQRVTTILAALLDSVSADRIVVVAVPDYTVTPAGADYGDPADRSAAIDVVNARMARSCAERSIAFVDIVDLSRLAGVDPTLVAADGLHPSGRQYARWVARIAPVVEALLAG